MKALNMAQFNKILNEIDAHHCLVKGRCVKYVDSSFDFRTNSIWRVVIRPFGEPRVFTVTNRFGDDAPKHDSLFEEIMDWLIQGEPVAK